jgi:fatty-acyl-CoA synthase
MVPAGRELPEMPVLSTLQEIEDFEETPLGERGLPGTTFEALRIGSAVSPGSPAISFFLQGTDFARPHVLTHEQFFEQVVQSANLFRRLGIGRRDVVAFLLPNLPETHFVIWGGEAAGIAFAVNPMLDAKTIADLLRAGRAKWLVALGPSPGADIWEKVEAIAPGLPDLEGILTVGVTPYLRGASRIAMWARDRMRRVRIPGWDRPILDFRRELARERGDRLNFDVPTAGDVSSYFCTGGTTGAPKIAKRTHFAEVYDGWALQTMTGVIFGPGTSVLCGLPLFHVNAQIITGLAAWMRGGHVVLASAQGYRGKGVIENFWKIVERYGITAFSGVPTVFSALLQRPIGGRDVSSMKFAICGAAPMPVDLFREFEEKAGLRIIEGFGLTEGTCASSANPRRADPRIGSIGLRLPYQDMASVILNAEGAFERFAGTDEGGELCIKGPNVFAGYLDEERTAKTFVEIDGERWLKTGDLARQDKDGYFWMTGRRKELIIRGGHNIDPKIIEEALQSHPEVALSAAVGRPDSHAGEIPVAYVQLNEGATATEDVLKSHAQERIGERAAWPKSIRILPSLPLTQIGKIHKPTLIMREIESVVQEEARKTGVALSSVEVEQDPKLGPKAVIIAEGDPDPLEKALGVYFFAKEFRK